MRTILVEPTVLDHSAMTMENLNSQYQESYNRLYQAVEVLSNSWQGADNVAFVNQINGYRDDFLKISMLLTQYIEFLRNSARAYRQTQNELATQATYLTN